MRRLFRNNDLVWTEEAGRFAIEIEKAIMPIFNEYLKNGYSVRELGFIVMTCASAMEARRSLELRVKGREWEIHYAG